MYSLILMSAMAGTPDVASFGNGAGCTGCAGVSISYAASYSYSSGCGGYSSCGGGGARVGGLLRGVGRVVTAPFRLLGRQNSSCYGSSCYGSSCYGSACYGSSCFGPTFYSSACYGSCYGSSCFGSACYGSSYGSACYGSACYGSSCFGCAGYSPVILGETYGVPVAPAMPAVPLTSSAGESYGTVTLSGSRNAAPTVTVETPADAASASLSLELPAAATLYVDGQLIAGGGESRQFHTPALPRGQAFFYEVKAVVEVNGQAEVEQKRVVVKAGESLRESFPKLIASVKAAGGPAVASK